MFRHSYSGASKIASSPPGCCRSSPAGVQDSFSLERREKTNPASSKAVLDTASSQQEANCLHRAPAREFPKKSALQGGSESNAVVWI